MLIISDKKPGSAGCQEKPLSSDRLLEKIEVQSLSSYYRQHLDINKFKSIFFF